MKSGGSPTCELPEDELEGRMALAGLSSRSDVFNSPLLEGFVADAPDVFTAEVLSRLDDGDLAMLALVNQKMRKVVFTSVGEVRFPLRLKNHVGSISQLAWAKRMGCPWDSRTFASIARGGNVEVARWAKERGCPWDESTCSSAAAAGHLEMPQWLRANDCPWDESTCANAASGGHLEMLQWARANGCPWNEGTCRERGVGRPPGGAEVGARERLPVERGDLRGRGGGTEVLSGRRDAPVDWGVRRAGAATWVLSGRARTAARGTRGLAARRDVAATWRCCSGRARTAARGTRGRARARRRAATSRC